MIQTKRVAATGVLSACFVFVVVAAWAIPGESSRSPAPTPLFASTVDSAGGDSWGEGDPVIVASGEGLLVRAPDASGAPASHEVRAFKSGRIVVPPGHVARFQVNLSVEPVTPIRLILSPKWDINEGQRYPPATRDFFVHTKLQLSGSEETVCTLPEGTFDIRIESAIGGSDWVAASPMLVHYAWEGKAHLAEATMFPPQSDPPRCLA